MKDDNEPPEMIEKALRDNSTYLVVDADDKDDDETTPFVPALYDSMREITTALEQQREYIDDKMTKRDEELIRLVREQQETKRMIAASEEKKRFLDRKSVV